MRDSFIFYRSFYDAIKELPRDVQGEIYTAIMEYSLYGKETEDLKPIGRSIFSLIKPQIDANLKRYSNGCKGGRPKNEIEKEPNENQKGTEIKPTRNQTETNIKPNVNVNVNVNDIIFLSNARVCEKLKNVYEVLLLDKAWNEPLMMNNHIKIEYFTGRLQFFFAKLQNEGQTEISENEAKMYFSRWLQNDIYQEKNKKNNGRSSESKAGNRKASYGKK